MLKEYKHLGEGGEVGEDVLEAVHVEKDGLGEEVFRGERAIRREVENPDVDLFAGEAVLNPIGKALVGLAGADLEHVGERGGEFVGA